MAYTIGLPTPSGEGAAPADSDRCWVSKFTSGAAGTMVEGTVCFLGTTGGTSGRFVVLSVTGGEPDAVLAYSEITVIPAGASTTVFPLNGEAVAASTDYYLGIVTSDFNAAIDEEATASGYQKRLANGTFSIVTPPATWPGSDASYTDNSPSVALVVDDSGGGGGGGRKALSSLTTMGVQ